jgi:drug/metabolite transporter (DMT)-like permease
MRVHIMSRTLQGILIFVSTCCIYALLNCVIRELTKTLDSYTIVAYRSLACLILMGPFLAFLCATKRVTWKLFNQSNFYKGALDFLSMPLWFLAIANLQIAQAVSLSYTTPLFTAVLAVLLLKEKVGIERWLALLIGLIGVYVIIKPDINGFNIYSLFILGASMLWALGSILTKNLTSQQHPVLIAFYTNLFIFIISLPLFFNNQPVIDSRSMFLITASALLSCIASVGLAYAFSKTKLTVLLPFDYTRLIFASSFAFIFYHEIISLSTVMGSMLILFASLYVANRRYSLKTIDKTSRIS